MLAQPFDENLMRMLIIDTNSGKEREIEFYKKVDSLSNAAFHNSLILLMRIVIMTTMIMTPAEYYPSDCRLQSDAVFTTL